VVRLPRETEIASDEHAAQSHISRAAPQRILIADDNEDLAESMAMLLRLEGHDVRYGQPEDRVRTEASGFDFHMVKPIDAQTVAAEISKWARERDR
jgi:hypothetical protein